MSTFGMIIGALIIGFFCGGFLIGLIAGVGRNNQLEEAYTQGYEAGINAKLKEKEGCENNGN